MSYDLHRHLEGSHSATALLDVAQRFNVRAALFFDEATQRWRSVDEVAGALRLDAPSDDAMHFYRRISLARLAYVSVEAVRALSLSAFLEAAKECDGFEMRISLFSMTRTLLENEGLVWRTLAPDAFAARAAPVLEAVLSARDEAESRTHKPMHVRLGLSRTFESEPHYRALVPLLRSHAAQLSGLDVLGIVAGADKEPLPDALRDILETLRADLPDLTIHAGEFEGAESVERTLLMAPQGIGHGVRSVESSATMAKLAQLGVTLEVCPMSNHLLIPTALASLRARHGGRHPLVVLQAAHVHCVLGSDDPTPMGTDFPSERRRAAELGVDEARLAQDTVRRWQQLPRRSVGATSLA